MTYEKKVALCVTSGLIAVVLVVVGIVTDQQDKERGRDLKTVHLIQQSFWAGYNTRMQGWPPQNISSKLFNSKGIDESRKILEIYSDLIESDKLPKNER